MRACLLAARGLPGWRAVKKSLRAVEGAASSSMAGSGFHLIRKHFYSPIPDLEELAALPATWWECESDLPGIEMSEGHQVSILRTFSAFQAEYCSFPQAPTGLPHAFHFHNGLFDGTDALVLYCMVRHLRPERIIEVGGGYSTFVSAAAARINGNTALTCIEPYPNDTLRAGFPGLARLIVQKVQQVPVDFFRQLGDGDVLFIDSTHTVKTGGDVNYLLLEVVPHLRQGVYVHFHDIFLPTEYPRSWVLDLHLFWAEMYLLRAFLMYNDAFGVVFANHFMGLRHKDELQRVFPNSPWVGGGSFWIRKRK